jgi:hypothetical protein
MVGAAVVRLPRSINHLDKGAGEIGPLAHNGYFQRRPHLWTNLHYAFRLLSTLNIESRQKEWKLMQFGTTKAERVKAQLPFTSHPDMLS